MTPQQVDPARNWEPIQLGHLATFRNGINFSSDSFGAGLRIINVADFGDRVVPDYGGLTEISDKALPNSESLLADGDIIAVRSNGNRMLIGRTMFIRMPPRVTHSAFTIRIRVNKDARSRLMPEFLAYVLRGPIMRSVLSNQGHGTNISNLNQDILRRLNLLLPHLDTQRKIVAVLSAYDDLMENNKRRIRLLEEIAQRIYREWFIDFRYPGHQGVPLVDSALGSIPHGWEVLPVGEVTSILGGGTPSKAVPEYWQDGTVTWYTPTDLTAADAMFMSKSKVRISSEGLARSSARLFPAGSVMMTSRATIGVVSITTVPAATNQGFITCPANESVGSFHMYFWLLAQRDLIISLASGATFKEISKATFRQIPFLRATNVVESDFEAIVEPIGREIINLLKAQRNLRTTRDLLMPRLISGEIDVADHDIAVPEGAV